MKNNYTAVVKQDGDWWIGWIEEVPGVNCQEATRSELLESLKITLDEALESLEAQEGVKKADILFRPDHRTGAGLHRISAITAGHWSRTTPHQCHYCGA